jgi:hypothetical protein
MKTLIAAVLVVAACGPETTSFRTTDQSDGERDGPSAAAYSLGNVNVRVWSNGGYISASEEPVTHIGFEIRNAGTRPVVFDGDALDVALFDKTGAALPAARFVAVTPLGPAQVSADGKTTMMLDAYFLLPVRPRVVNMMRVHWTLKIGDTIKTEMTTFVRDDEGPVTDPPPRVYPTEAST